METSIREKIGQPAAITKTPPEIRSIILNAIGEGFNTMHVLCLQTGLDNGTIAREVEVLKDIVIFVHPGPPVTSYWLKSRTPKGRIVISADGKAIEVKMPKMSKAEKSKMLAEAAARHARIEEDELDNEFPDGDLQFNEISDEYRAAFPLKFLIEHPLNPRGMVDQNENSFQELVESIRAVGVQEPLIITPVEGQKRFRIVIGHRRAKAARRAGLDAAPCIVRRFRSKDVEEDVMLIENIQRQNLKPTMEGRAFKRIYDKEGENINAVARRVGLTQSYIQRRMKLLSLDPAIQLMVDSGELGLETGDIISVLSPDKQRRIVGRAQRMKPGELRELVSKMKNSTGSGIPVSRRKQAARARVTGDEEKFTRSWAIKELDSMGDAAWISIRYLKDAFDDVCIDSCLESKDESICRGCPVPRMIAAVVRHKQRGDQ